jgi:trans-2,3-dihydro-3-hydroxyanthranilate isomerase
MRLTRSYRYHVVDVFTQVPLEGNAAAVFPQAEGLETETMQSIARELNLPETVFIFPAEQPDQVARLRIFAPRKEMDFAGHPTIAAGYILRREKIVAAGATSFAVEENIGIVELTVDAHSMLWLKTPPIKTGPTIAPEAAASVLNLDLDALLTPAPQVMDAGNPTLLIALRDRATVDAARFDTVAWAGLRKRYHLGPMCAVAFAPVRDGERPGAYTRMFAPDYGIAEDPATGSSTGPLAFFMMQHHLAPSAAGTRLVSEQGTSMGRRSLLHIRVCGAGGCEGIEVGGHVTPIAESTMRF